MLLIAAIVMVGCSPATGSSPNQVDLAPSATPEPTAEPQQVEPTATSADEVVIEPTEDEAESEQDSSSDSSPANLPDQGAIPTGSSALKATDPNSVNLADGQPKLVEFFAFW